MADYNEIDTLMKRIEDLEARLAVAETAPRLAASGVGEGGITVHDGGGVTVKDGGGITIDDAGSLDVTGGGNVYITDGGDLVLEQGAKLRVLYPDSLGGGVMAELGTITGGTYGMRMTRADGTPMFVAHSSAAGNAHEVIMYDNQGVPVAGNAMSTGRGLTWPVLPAYATPSDYTKWGSTQSGSFTTVAEGYAQVYHQSCWISFRHTSNTSGTAGEARVVLWNSSTGEVQIGPTHGVSFSINYSDSAGSVPVPISSWVYVRLQVRRTAGTGSVMGTIVGVEFTS